MKLTNLATVCRQAHLTTIEEEGLDKVSGRFIPWTQFGRSGNSGYSASGPTHVMVHHTASSASIQNDVRYCQVSSSIRPLTNLIVARDGNVHVCAAGPSNTNGSGTDTWGGGTPDNQMNARAIGIELCNNGIGEPYPVAQQVALLELTVALCRAYDIPVNQVRGHFEWAPTRKIDPSGPSRWNDNQNRKWDMDAFRNTVAQKLNTPSGDDKMLIACKNSANPSGVHVGDGVFRWWMTDDDWGNRFTELPYTWLGSVPAEKIRTLGTAN